MTPSALEKRIFQDILQIDSVKSVSRILERYPIPDYLAMAEKKSGPANAFYFNFSGLLALQNGTPHLYVEILNHLSEGIHSLLSGLKPTIFLRFHKGKGSSYSVIYGKKVWLVQLPLFFSTIRPDFFKLLGCAISARQGNYRLPDHLLKEIQETVRKHHPGRKTAAAFHEPLLLSVFNRLNQRYFNTTLALPNLKWSRGLAYRKLGAYNDVSRTITISKLLIHPDVPAAVLDFVMYHEMLHMKFPIKVVNGRRRIHTPEFRRAEKEFERFGEVEVWLKEELPKLTRKLSKGKSVLFRKKLGF